MSSSPATEPAAERLARLERELDELKRRLDALERYLAGQKDHPRDRTVVREKAVFDWQQ